MVDCFEAHFYLGTLVQWRPRVVCLDAISVLVVSAA
jgi:hypothetical protein